METLHTLLEHSTIPFVTALILGLLTAVSPCPLATNITAICFISKDVNSKHKVFINGLFYTFGRILTYSILGMILIPIVRTGASMYYVQKLVSSYGDMFVVPVLVLIGIWMLDIIKIQVPSVCVSNTGMAKLSSSSLWGFITVLFIIYKNKNMKSIEIYDPAMCCSTGLCGTNIDPELMRIAVVVETLKRRGVAVKRHNLRDEPQAYVENKAVNDFLKKHGAEALPLTLVDGEIVLSKTYPTTQQMSEWSGLDLSIMYAK